MINQDIQQLATLIASQISSQIGLQPRWLNLKQAAAYSNIGQKKLIELAQKNIINGFQDIALKTTPWIFDKKSLDEYRGKQVFKSRTIHTDEDQIVKGILSSIGS